MRRLSFRQGIGGALLALLLWAPALAQDKPGPAAQGTTATGTPAVGTPDRAVLKQLMRELLREEPELVMEALQTLEARERQQTESKAAAALVAKRGELERSPGDLVIGNPGGDVTLVEFFDYRCPYCKQVVEPMLRVIRADGKVRLVLKELPILGRESVVAAQAALASDRQGKYAAMHEALMAHKGALDESAVMRIAASVGLDEARLKADMGRADVQAKLRANLDLAKALEIRGTPAFVIGDSLAPGALDEAGIRAMIVKARGG